MNDATQVRADELLGRRRRAVRALVTPDGVPLRIEIADFGERLAAFAIDFVITIFAADVLVLAGLLLAGLPMAGATLAAVTFAAFVVRNAYFVAFEIAWAGVTPGKRALGLRVIDRHGGALTPVAVVARNLSREVEIFFPLGMLLQSESWLASPWEIVPVALWLVLTSALPLCNRDRLRAGDLIGGTIVISVPKKLLLDDLVSERTAFTFTDEQLQRYGILELQILEEVLRRPDTFQTGELLADIAQKVQRKIQWTGGALPPDRARAFLRDFYAAQRAFLELRKHLGDERADKFHARQTSGRRQR
jgi:uncharacterized RDD family membrane protein YckC